MRKDLGPDVLFNTIMMMRMRSCRTVLLAESSVDAAFYQRFVSGKDCFLGDAVGRLGVLNMLDRLSACSVPACGGIIDADADYALGRPKPHQNAYRTHKTDKETTIVDSPAFVAFCATLNVSMSAENLRGILYAAALPLGAIRRQGTREGFALDFKQIVYSNFIHAGPACDINQCCAEVKARNPHVDISLESLIDFVQDTRLREVPKSHIVQGHDLTAILSLQSCSLFGRHFSQAALETELSNSYTLAHFLDTTTYGELSRWEGTIAPRFRVF